MPPDDGNQIGSKSSDSARTPSFSLRFSCWDFLGQNISGTKRRVTRLTNCWNSANGYLMEIVIESISDIKQTSDTIHFDIS